MITQQELKEILNYDPEAGLFYWKANRAKNKIKAKDVAGTEVNGYIKITINGKTYAAHRLAWLYMYGSYPNGQIDHINQVKNDNRSSNLREASDKDNKRNRPKQKNNTSGINGVNWYKRDSKWLAYIGVNKKSINLGYFADKFEAICARKSAENKFGFHENHGKLLQYEGA